MNDYIHLHPATVNRCSVELHNYFFELFRFLSMQNRFVFSINFTQHLTLTEFIHLRLNIDQSAARSIENLQLQMSNVISLNKGQQELH